MSIRSLFSSVNKEFPEHRLSFSELDHKDFAELMSMDFIAEVLHKSVVDNIPIEQMAANVGVSKRKIIRLIREDDLKFSEAALLARAVGLIPERPWTYTEGQFVSLTKG